MLQRLPGGYLGLMALYRPPHLLPVLTGVQACGNRPISPGVRSAFLAVDLHQEFAKNGHILLQPGLCSRSIVQPGYTVWRQVGRERIVGISQLTTADVVSCEMAMWSG